MDAKRILLIVGLVVGLLALPMLGVFNMVRDFTQWSKSKRVLGFQVLNGSAVYTTTLNCGRPIGTNQLLPMRRPLKPLVHRTIYPLALTFMGAMLRTYT